jgi:hypothetical protein
MLIFSFSSYSSFLLASPLTPPSPPPSSSPQKLNLLIIRGQIVILERTTLDVNGHPRL